MLCDDDDDDEEEERDSLAVGAARGHSRRPLASSRTILCCLAATTVERADKLRGERLAFLLFIIRRSSDAAPVSRCSSPPFQPLIPPTASSSDHAPPPRNSGPNPFLPPSTRHPLPLLRCRLLDLHQVQTPPRAVLPPPSPFSPRRRRRLPRLVPANPASEFEVLTDHDRDAAAPEVSSRSR